MLKKAAIIMFCLLLCGCNAEKTTIRSQEDNIKAVMYAVNEIGIFGFIDETGISYYDFNQGEKIQLLENKDNQYREGFTTGFALYYDKLYSFQRTDGTGKTVLNVKDIDGSNSRDLIEIPLKGYDTSLTGKKSIYYKQKVIFTADYSKMFEDSSKNESTHQILMYDLKTNRLNEVTPVYDSDNKYINLIGAVDEYAVYSMSTYNKHKSYDEFEKAENDATWHTEQVIRSRNNEIYLYNIHTKKTELLLKGKGMHISPYENIHGLDLIYRIGDDVFTTNIKTKETKKLFSEKNMIIMGSCLDNKVFYVTYDAGIWKFKYYDFKDKTTTQYTLEDNNKNEKNSLYMTYENSEYFFCIYADQEAVISKKDFYNSDFDKIKVIG